MNRITTTLTDFSMYTLIQYDVCVKWEDDGVHFPAHYFSSNFVLPDNEEDTHDNIEKLIRESLPAVFFNNTGYKLDEALVHSSFISVRVYNVRITRRCDSGFEINPIDLDSLDFARIRSIILQTKGYPMNNDEIYSEFCCGHSVYYLNCLGVGGVKVGYDKWYYICNAFKEYLGL